MTLNTAFVFIKPHAVNDNVVSLVERTLADYRVRVDSTGTLSSEDIRRHRIIDKHYSTIFTYAMDKQPSAVRLSVDAEERFKDTFGVSFDDVIRNPSAAAGLKVMNAASALEVLEKSGSVPEGKTTAQYLSDLFAASSSKSRLAPGMYAATVSLPNEPNPVVVFNGFYPCNQEKFTAPNREVRWFVVRWRPQDLSWADFRGKVIGPTDPSKAPEGSLRRLILKDWEALGLATRPNVSDNGVHASAGPVEGFVEQRVWLNLPSSRSAFALAAVHRGIPERFLAELENNPDITLAGRAPEPAFDLFEDKDTPWVIDQLAEFVRQEDGLPVINTAIVFIKPHACHKPLVKQLVETTLIENGIRIVMEGTKHADAIEENQLVDRHYAAIARFARTLPGSELAAELNDEAHRKFQEAFGAELADVCAKGLLLNAFEAMESIRDVGPTTAETLSTIWRVCDTKAKVAPGLYIGFSSESGKYFTNGFYPSIREKFTAKGKAVHWFVVSWPERELTWSDFRSKVIGSTDPAAAPRGSLRELILSNWRDLGLEERPNTSDNGVHASAGPLEGIVERLTWVGGRLEDDITCRFLRERGVESHISVQHWITNAVINKVTLPDGTTRGPGPAFDLLEDIQTSTFIEIVRKAEEEEMDSQSRNYAFVFVKPHANTTEVQNLVDGVFKINYISVEDSGVCTGDDLGEKGIIDRHYAAISSLAMATRERAPVPGDKRELEIATSSVLFGGHSIPVEGQKAFEDTFGTSWEEAAQGGYLVTAQEALDLCDISPLQLAKRWSSTTRCRTKVKVASGVYVGHFSRENIYVVNGFYPAIQSKMTAPWARVQWYVVSWAEERLSWGDFRGKVIGPTDPSKAPEGSLRRLILKDWEALGLAARPNVSDNGVHASAGPLEGLAERRVWLSKNAASPTPIGQDPFGKALIQANISRGFIDHCLSNPTLHSGTAKSTFDATEELNSTDAAALLQAQFSAVKKEVTTNRALMFIKPHAVNEAVMGVLREVLQESEINVEKEGAVWGADISASGAIDRHYSTIAHVATKCVPTEEIQPFNIQAGEKFYTQFGEDWDTTLASKRVYNAVEATKVLAERKQPSQDAANFDVARLWSSAEGDNLTARLGPGTYVAFIKEHDIYILNGFYLSLRAKFTDPGAQLRWLSVSWDSAKLSWADFRHRIVGSTRPSDAVEGSIRSLIFKGWSGLGLASEPTTSDNGIHASAGPLEAIRERACWMTVGSEEPPVQDGLVGALLDLGVHSSVLDYLVENPRVSMDGKEGNVFDLYEDKQTSEFVEAVQGSASTLLSIIQSEAEASRIHADKIALALAQASSPQQGSQQQQRPSIPVARGLRLRHVRLAGANSNAEPPKRNTAFVFIKPHAVAGGELVESLVEDTLAHHKIRVDMEGEITGAAIAEARIIDQHYSAISSYSLDINPKDIDVGTLFSEEVLSRFASTFGVTWENGVKVGAVCNAAEVLAKHNYTPESLSVVVGTSAKKLRLIPGLYAAHIHSIDVIVLNGFYPCNREKFTRESAAVHWYVVSWAEERLSWGDFRGKVIGPTDPSKAPEGSLRRLILKDWEALGLPARPDVSDNGVHASAGPLEGLAERRVWLGSKIGEDPFGRLLKGRHSLTERFITYCCTNPSMELDLAPPPTGTEEGEGTNLAVIKSGPVFDLLEDKQSSFCGEVLQRAFEEDRRARMENTALVFVKPHAVNPLVAGLVEAAFKENGMTVHQQGIRNAREIRNGNLIDAHYTTISGYALNWKNDLERQAASDACFDEMAMAELDATNPIIKSIVDSSGKDGLKSTETKFLRLFAEPLDYALKTGRLMSAASALQHLQVVRDHTKNAFLSDYTRMTLEAELYDRWNKADTFMKLAGGAYVKEIVLRTPGKDEEPSPLVDHTIPSIFVVNGFYPQLRHGYLANLEGSLHVANVMWYVVSWRESTLSWKDFRGKFIGCTDPSAAPDGSLRGAIYSGWKELGLRTRPNTSDNGVHASAGPLEGLVERYIWSIPHPDTEEPMMPPVSVDEISSYLHYDPVGQLLVDHEIDPEIVAGLCVNPMVIVNGRQAPIFDQTEDMQTSLLPQLILTYIKEGQERARREEEEAAQEASRTQAQAVLMAEADATQRIPSINSAVLLVKPQTAKEGVTEFLKEKLTTNHISIVSESIQSAASTSTARLRKLIDAHHGDTALYACDAPPRDIVPTDEGRAAFEILAGADYVALMAGKAAVASSAKTSAWDHAVSIGQVVNAERALLELGSIKPSALNARWDAIPSDSKVEIATGVFVGHLVDAEMFVINGFYPSLRDSYVSSESSIHTWMVEWREEDLSWADFRSHVVGCGDPAVAPVDSLCGFLFNNWRSLGLDACPTEETIGIHVSNGPLQAVIERRVWFKQPMDTDPFVVECLVKRGVSKEMFQPWLDNNVVSVTNHLRGKAFDLLINKQTSEAANIIADAAEFTTMALIPTKKVALSPKRRLFNATLQDRFIHINTMTSEEEMRDLFNYYDKDNSGSIDRREFLADYLHFEQYGQPLQRGRVQDMFTKFDRNHDGRLSFDEFCMVMLERVAHM